MGEFKFGRIVGSLVLAISAGALTIWKWVLVLEGDPLERGRGPSVLFLGPFFGVVGIGTCFLSPWKEEEESRRRGDPKWQRMRLPMPAGYATVMLLGVVAGMVDVIVISVWFARR
jgi:hypothetical protein